LANWGWGTLVDLLKLGAGVGLAATGLGAPAAAAMLPAGFIGPPVAAGMSAAALGTTAAGASMGLGGASGLANSASAPSDDEIRAANEEQARAAMRKPYQRSSFMPQPGQGPAARYAPQNRQMQSGVDPDVMQFLMKYMRPR